VPVHWLGDRTTGDQQHAGVGDRLDQHGLALAQKYARQAADRTGGPALPSGGAVTPEITLTMTPPSRASTGIASLLNSESPGSLIFSLADRLIHSWTPRIRPSSL
jgi:hypothetical protein